MLKKIFRPFLWFWIRSGQALVGFVANRLPERFALSCELQGTEFLPCMVCENGTLFRKGMSGPYACRYCVTSLYSNPCHECGRTFYWTFKFPPRRYETIWCEYHRDDVMKQLKEHDPKQYEHFNEVLTGDSMAKLMIDMSTSNELHHFVENGSDSLKTEYYEFIEERKGKRVKKKEVLKWMDDAKIRESARAQHFSTSPPYGVVDKEFVVSPDPLAEVKNPIGDWTPPEKK